ncbi:MAG: hypothetical protein AAB289_08135, partial [Chloroflexota bacterium]
MFLVRRVGRWRVERKKKVDEQRAVRGRLVLLHGLVVLCFVILAAQLWRMQVVEGSRYQERAEANRLRLFTVPPQRGVVYDRTGRLLVKNRPSFAAAAVVA